MEISLTHYLIIGAVMFVCGVGCMATKRNGIAVLMGVELVLNGANVNFVAFARYTNLDSPARSFRCLSSSWLPRRPPSRWRSL